MTRSVPLDITSCQQSKVRQLYCAGFIGGDELGIGAYYKMRHIASECEACDYAVLCVVGKGLDADKVYEQNRRDAENRTATTGSKAETKSWVSRVHETCKGLYTANKD